MHDVAHGEEIGRDIDLRDDHELVLELRAHDLGDAGRVATCCSFVRERAQAIVGARVIVERSDVERSALGARAVGRRHRLLCGERVLELTELEGAGIGDLACAHDRGAVISEPALLPLLDDLAHLVVAADARLGVRHEPLPGAVDAQPLPHAREHVVQALVVAVDEERARGRDERDSEVVVHVFGPGQAGRVFGRPVQEDADGAALFEPIDDVDDGAVAERGQHRAPQASVVLEDVEQVVGDLAFLSAFAGTRQNLAEVRVALGRGGVQHDRPLVHPQLAGDDDAHADLFAAGVGADDASERVEVGDGDGIGAEHGGALDDLFRAPCPRPGARGMGVGAPFDAAVDGEAREARAHAELDVA